MAFCPKCGAQVEDGVKFCPSCGGQIGSGSKDFSDTVNKIIQSDDRTAEFDQADIDSNKAMGILSYIGILFLIPLFAAPNSRFARFHVNQGVVLFLASLVVSIPFSIIKGIFTGLDITFLAVLAGLVMSVWNILVFVLMILGIINAAKGTAKELPIIGKFTIIK